jgi:hypothetical protein
MFQHVRTHWVRVLGLTLALTAVLGAALAAPVALRAETQAPAATEMKVYDFNGNVSQAYGGFVMDKTSAFLKQNWVSPVNYAQGTLHFRAIVRDIPKTQTGMKLGFCFWQGSREMCKGSNTPAYANQTRTYTWSVDVSKMWKKNGQAVDFSQPRKKMGFAVRDGQNDPVSNKTSNNWGGNNPADWYPLNVRFTVVAVAKGASFSGWNNY